MASVTFLLFDGFSNMVLSCLLEPLRAVRDQAQLDIRWQILAPGNRPVRSSSGLMIAPDGTIEAPGQSDMLVVLTGYGFRAHAEPGTLRLLSALARQSRTLVGADTGAWLIAAAGLLRDQRATLHWAVLSDFAEAFPDIHVTTDRYVMEGRIWSCGGASSALDLILAYISDRFGQANAFLASTMFLHDAERPQSGPRQNKGVPGQLAGQLAGRLTGRGTARLRQAVNLMVETIETPLPLGELAARAGVSASSLDRLFQSELGMAPGRYYQMLRLSQARELAASTDFDLREIALRCGYADAAALSKAFSRTYGHPIRKSRGVRPRRSGVGQGSGMGKRL